MSPNQQHILLVQNTMGSRREEKGRKEEEQEIWEENEKEEDMEDIAFWEEEENEKEREGQESRRSTRYHSMLGQTVYIKTVFLKIEDINTIQETFTGMVFIRARWREPLLDRTQSREIDKINWGSMWGPRLDVHNVKGDAKQEVWNDIQYTASGEAYAMEKRRVKGTFTEKMELQEFPFDIQDLSVLVTSDHTEGDIDLQEDREDLSNVVTNNFVDEQEWHLKRFVQCTPRVTEDEFVQNKHRKPGLFFRCCVIRRAGFFIWNIMLVMSIISALSFVTFAVSQNLAQNRIQLSFILLLAGVTFKFAASQSVPKISYLTHLDRYILGSMIFLFLVAAYHGVITRVDDAETADDIDTYVFIVFVCLYVILHIIFITAMAVRGFKRRQDVHDREQEYLERMIQSGQLSDGRVEPFSITRDDVTRTKKSRLDVWKPTARNAPLSKSGDCSFPSSPQESVTTRSSGVKHQTGTERNAPSDYLGGVLCTQA